MRLGTGLSAAVAFAIDWWATGATLFILSMLLDRGDGDYARVSGQTSHSGHKYDLVADTVCNAVIFIGLGFGLHGGAFGYWAVPMGVVAGLAVTAVLGMVIRAENLAGQRSAEIGNLFGFDPDDAMLAVPILVLLGYQEQLLLAAVIGAPLFTLIFFIGWRIKFKSTAASGTQPE